VRERYILLEYKPAGFAGAAAGEAVFVVVTFGAICESKRMKKKIVLKL
jgi:hypothetical protein